VILGRGAANLFDMIFDQPRETGKLYLEGTHRTAVPAATLKRVKPHIARMGITRTANLTGLDRLNIPVYAVFRPNSKSVAVAQGKGLTRDAAKVSGLMEALEVYHAETISRAPRIASFEALHNDGEVIDVKRLPVSAKNALSPEQPIPWLGAKWWRRGTPVWVPLEQVSSDYTLPLMSGYGFFQANTNGLASGNHPAEAVLHAACELIERDATALWWHRTRVSREARCIDLGSVADQACRSVLGKYKRAGVDVTVWDTTTDIGIASFLCAVHDAEGHPYPELGAGCHPCREIALLRALTEAAQARTTFISGSRDDLPRGDYTPSAVAARLEHFRALEGISRGGMSLSEVPNFSSDTIAEDLDHVVKGLVAAGMDDMAVVDLTREEIGIPVVRALIPGLEGLADDDSYLPGSRALSVGDGIQ
jgi:YcaO-like protein with predicted kinase domain